jgi:hypothetical protein
MSPTGKERGFTMIGSVSEGLVEKEQQHADTCKKKQSA